MSILEVSGLSFSYPNTSFRALDDISFSLEDKGFLYIVGGARSGKSTLGLAMAGIIPNLLRGDFSGTVMALNADTSTHSIDQLISKIGIVLQDPDTQIIETRVEDEVAFPLENLGVPPAKMKERVWSAMEQLGIAALSQRDPIHLSGGEKQRLSIAVAIALQPRVLIFDEPFADLDSDGVDRCWNELKNLQSRLGLTVILMDKKVPDIPPLDFDSLVLRGGRLVRRSSLSKVWQDSEFWKTNGITPPLLAEISNAFQISTSLPHSLEEVLEMIAKGFSRREAGPQACYPCEEKAAAVTEVAIHCSNVSFAFEQTGMTLDQLTFSANSGEVLAIVGHNGSGKTTVLRLIAGLISPCSGSVEVLGSTPSNFHNRELHAQIGLFLQDPQPQLLFDVVEQDLRFAALGFNQGLDSQISEFLNDIAEGFGIREVLSSSPEKLSYGEKHRAGLAAVFSNPRLRIVLLDEPTRALDPNGRAFLKKTLLALRSRGACVVISSHDIDFVYEISDRVMAMSQGVVVSQGSPSSVLGSAEVRQKCRILPAKVLEVCNTLRIQPVRSVQQLTEYFVQ